MAELQSREKNKNLAVDLFKKRHHLHVGAAIGRPKHIEIELYSLNALSQKRAGAQWAPLHEMGILPR